MIPRWLTPWLRPKKSASDTGLPWAMSPQEVDALKALRASPHWRHYLAVIERVVEAQAGEFTAGLPHDRYLFACGSLSAFRRLYTLVDDLIETATRMEIANNARTDAANRRSDHDPFLNTPWYGLSTRREH